MTEHKPSRQEIRDLLAVADRDLSDSSTPGLSADWRLNIAYNAALQAATAALAAAGFRATRDSHHYRVIQSLVYTIGAGSAVVSQLDRFRKKRNIAGYEKAGLASDQEAREMSDLAREARAKVEKWIGQKYPELL